MPETKDPNKVFQEYYESLKKRMQTGKLVTERNHDRVHNSAIMKLMLDGGGEVAMFCGSMSVFRRDFYDHITRDYPNYSAEDIRSSLAESLSEFLANRNNSLSILLENPVENLFDDMIISKADAEAAVRNGVLKIRRLRDDFLWKDQLSHFCFSQSGLIRVEDNKTTHEGLFVGNDEELFKDSKSCFEDMLTRAEAV